jgi:hypothetical protein
MKKVNILYHASSSENRKSILQHGLLLRYDKTGDANSIPGIYLIDRFIAREGGDIYEVDVSGLELEHDDAWNFFADSEGKAYVCYSNIPPERIRLIS